MLRTGQEHLERLNDGRIVYIGDERVDNVTTHPAFKQRRPHHRGDLRHEGRSGQRRDAVFCRERRTLQHVLPAGAHAGRSAAADARAQDDRRPDPWAVRPVARSLRELGHGHGDGSRRVRKRNASLFRKPCSPTTATSVTTTSTWPMPFSRRKPRATRRSINAKACRFRAWRLFEKRTTASSFPG